MMTHSEGVGAAAPSYALLKAIMGLSSEERIAIMVVLIEMGYDV